MQNGDKQILARLELSLVFSVGLSILAFMHNRKAEKANLIKLLTLGICLMRLTTLAD